MEKLYVIQGKSILDEVVYYDTSTMMFDNRSYMGTRFFTMEDAEKVLNDIKHIFRYINPQIVLK
jgi:hypothetical protein